MSGTVANFISASIVGMAFSYPIGQSAPMVATLWGLLWFREFRGTGFRCMLLVCSCCACFCGAIALISLSKS